MPPTVTTTNPIDPIQSMPELRAVCARHGVSRLRLFGSALRGDGRPDSDVDLLVEFRTGRPVTFLDLEALALDLSPLFGGRQVDLIDPASLHWYIKKQVLDEARVIYEG